MQNANLYQFHVKATSLTAFQIASLCAITAFSSSLTHTKSRHTQTLYSIYPTDCVKRGQLFFSASAGKVPGEILQWGLESQCSHYVISPTRPVVYPCRCSLFAKVVSLAGSPPEPLRKSSTCTRPTLPIPDQDTHGRTKWMSKHESGDVWHVHRCKHASIHTGWTSFGVSVTWAYCITPRHESRPAWSAERSSCDVLSELHSFRGQFVYVRSPAGNRAGVARQNDTQQHLAW